MLISFIIPTYNRLALLERAINSIVASEIPKEDYEIIIVDDGSDCDNEPLVRQYTDVKIFYLRKAVNSNNRSMIRNEGIIYAKGKYIRFLDDDDYFNSIGLFKEYEHIINNNINVDIIFVNCVKFRIHKGTNIHGGAIQTGRFNGLYNFFIKRSYLLNNNLMFDDKVFVTANEDLYFFLLIRFTKKVIPIEYTMKTKYTSYNMIDIEFDGTKYRKYTSERYYLKLYTTLKELINMKDKRVHKYIKYFIKSK